LLSALFVGLKIIVIWPNMVYLIEVLI
jgi:hypothetical protein